MNNNHSLTKNSVYTVSQLNRETKEILSQYFMTVRVAGEISNLSTPSIRPYLFYPEKCQRPNSLRDVSLLSTPAYD